MPDREPQSDAESKPSEQPKADRSLKALLRDEAGTTSLEWLLLLGAIAIPSIVIFTISLNAVIDYYRMMTTLNSLPFP